MWFRNDPDAGEGRCACGTWERHWMHFNPGGPSSALFQRECAVQGCHGPFELGAHVRRIGIRPPEAAVACIVPMCRSCHRSPDLTFQLKPGLQPAPADPALTCDRPR